MASCATYMPPLAHVLSPVILQIDMSSAPQASQMVGGNHGQCQFCGLNLSKPILKTRYHPRSSHSDYWHSGLPSLQAWKTFFALIHVLTLPGFFVVSVRLRRHFASGIQGQWRDALEDLPLSLRESGKTLVNDDLRRWLTRLLLYSVTESCWIRSTNGGQRPPQTQF